MTRRLTALELDAALIKLGAALAALTPEARAAIMPPATAFTDQVAAAREQSVGWSEHAEGARVGWARRTDIDEWLRLSALDTFLQWTDGRGRTCVHMPHYRRPEPVFSAAWRPGLVVCAHCLHLLDTVGDADATCDRCGHLCEGIDADDPIYPGTVWVGAMAHEYGVCGDCRPDLGSSVA